MTNPTDEDLQGLTADLEPYSVASIRKEQDRSQLRAVFLEAATSSVVAEMGPTYFAQLRERIRTPADPTG